MPVSGSSATCGQNRQQRKTQALPKFSSQPDSLHEFIRRIVPQTICRESRWLVLLSLGLCRGIGGGFPPSPWVCDGREGLPTEFFFCPLPRLDTVPDSLLMP